MWGRDQAPARHEAKDEMRLMPDSHNAVCESTTGGRIRLDWDLSKRRAGDGGTASSSLKVGRGLNLFSGRRTHQEARRPLVLIRQTRIRKAGAIKAAATPVAIRA